MNKSNFELLEQCEVTVERILYKCFTINNFKIYLINIKIAGSSSNSENKYILGSDTFFLFFSHVVEYYSFLCFLHENSDDCSTKVLAMYDSLTKKIIHNDGI